mmetsp:Transcript_120130/g.299682  ORF Transcript_120130/g.299682 Transcript_120130/m.299682 type:complete len:255 (-) Transcript_120130:7-771(-)
MAPSSNSSTPSSSSTSAAAACTALRATEDFRVCTGCNSRASLGASSSSSCSSASPSSSSSSQSSSSSSSQSSNASSLASSGLRSTSAQPVGAQDAIAAAASCPRADGEAVGEAGANNRRFTEVGSKVFWARPTPGISYSTVTFMAMPTTMSTTTPSIQAPLDLLQIWTESPCSGTGAAADEAGRSPLHWMGFNGEEGEAKAEADDDFTWLPVRVLEVSFVLWQAANGAADAAGGATPSLTVGAAIAWTRWQGEA